MIRFGLCCVFKQEPLKFRHTTAAFQRRFDRPRQLENLAVLCRHNARSLLSALTFCRDHGIGDFRINSQILPLKTHPDAGYDIRQLPDAETIISGLHRCGAFCRRHDIRTTFHPDQFILLSSPRPDVTEKSVNDLVYQAEVAEWVGADVINIHVGGAYGDKKAALRRFAKEIEKLPDAVRTRLTLENDDRTYTPADLLPVCRDFEIPLVYDVHHHRCLSDGGDVEATTEKAISTWQREPLFHLSSPLNGWTGKNPAPHHDYIDPADFPDFWKNLTITIEVEAKAKELAILKLKQDLLTV
jgi:UV DNA damage endonuclease